VAVQFIPSLLEDMTGKNAVRFQFLFDRAEKALYKMYKQHIQHDCMHVDPEVL
jgi:hypothetical protein